MAPSRATATACSSSTRTAGITRKRPRCWPPARLLLVQHRQRHDLPARRRLARAPEDAANLSTLGGLNQPRIAHHRGSACGYPGFAGTGVPLVQPIPQGPTSGDRDGGSEVLRPTGTESFRPNSGGSNQHPHPGPVCVPGQETSDQLPAARREALVSELRSKAFNGWPRHD